MRDVDLYRAILGLVPPWRVVSVALDIPIQQVTVKVDAGPGPFPCPECQAPVPGYDRRLRRWRHLDTGQFITWIETEIPRVECPHHGVKQLLVPWAEVGSQFTALFERLAIDLLRECSVEGAAAILRISWDEAWGIKQRAVRRGLARRAHGPVVHVGVDEKAIAKRHRYFTIVADLEAGCVLRVEEGRQQESLDRCWQSLTPEQREGTEAVAMDMWEPYIQSTLAHVPEAAKKIVFDKFHIAKHLHQAVDKVRRLEARLLRQAGDARLVGTRWSRPFQSPVTPLPTPYLWLMRPKGMKPEQRATLRALLAGEFKVARAWALKERFRQFWEYTYLGAAERFFRRWFWQATHSRLKPMAEVAWMIRRHLLGVLTYLHHRITNAGLEAVNAPIQWVKKTARGFRNPENFKTAIYFHCGGLDPYPHESR